MHAAATVWNALPVSVTSQRLTAIIQSSLKDSPLCIGIHVTALYLYVMNNAVIIMFLKMCYYYYSLYILDRLPVHHV